MNPQQNMVSKIEQNHSRFGIDTATSKSLMMSRIWKWNPKSVSCIQCWTLQTQMCGLAFSCTEMLHDRDYLLIVSLPLLFLPHAHTHLYKATPCSHPRPTMWGARSPSPSQVTAMGSLRWQPLSPMINAPEAIAGGGGDSSITMVMYFPLPEEQLD